MNEHRKHPLYRNDLGLLYPKIPTAPMFRAKHINSHQLNLKAKELLRETETVLSSEKLYAIQLAYWGLFEQKLEPNGPDMEKAVLILLLNTEPKLAMEFLLKERHLENAEYTILELQEMFQATDDPESGAEIVLVMIARALQETELGDDQLQINPQFSAGVSEVRGDVTAEHTRIPEQNLRLNLKQHIPEEQELHRMLKQEQKHNRLVELSRLMELSTLTSEQAELLLNAVDIAVEDEIDVLLKKETLDDFEQDVLAVLQTYSNNPDALTTEQDVLFKDFVGFIVEDEIAIFTQKDILTDSEQELLAALQVYESTSQPTPTSETESTSIETSKTTSENEKGKPNFTPKKALLYKRWVNYMVEQEIADLEDAEQNNEMVEGKQKLLDMLRTPIDQRTAEQSLLFDRWVDFIIGEEIADLEDTEQNNEMVEGEQELLDMLRARYPEPEITPVAKTENTYNSSSVQEKVVHYSEDQIKDIVADYFKSLPTASPGYSVKREI